LNHPIKDNNISISKVPFHYYIAILKILFQITISLYLENTISDNEISTLKISFKHNYITILKILFQITISLSGKHHFR